MEDRDIVKEIQQIEQAADKLIQEAEEKAKEIELASKREIEEIGLAAEKDLEIRAKELRSALNENKKREEMQLALQYEEAKKKLEEIDKETLNRLIDQAAENIYKG